MRKKSGLKIFLEALWTKSFTYWWVVSLLTILMFDLFWMSQTTFRAFQYLPFWPILFLGATILTLPSLFTRSGIYNTILLLAVDVLFIANLMYCRTYYNAIPFNSYFLVGNLSDFTASVADSFRWYFIFLPISTLFAYVVYLIVKPRREKKPDPLPYIVGVVTLFFLTWLSDIHKGGAFAHMEQMHDNAYESSSISPVYSIPGFLMFDFKKGSEKLSESQEKMVADWLEEHGKLAPYHPLERDSLSRIPRNLLIVMCESLEDWPIGKVVEGKELTPRLNRLIEDSTTFYAPSVLTQVGSGRSIDGQLLLLTGMYPMRNNVYSYEVPGNTFFSLPKALKERNKKEEKEFKSYFITCDKPYVWNQARVAEAFGVDTLITAADFLNDEPVGGHKRLSDGGLMRQSIEKMKAGEIWPVGEDAFMMWVTYSGHNPFRLPENLRRISFEGNYPETVKNYMITANYTDYAIGVLTDYLKSRPDWEDTMVVITGDHEGLASDRKEAMENPLSSVFVDPGQHTPLIILNSPVAGRYDSEMGEADIYTTLLQLMGLDDYPWKGMGMSVISPDHPGVAVGSIDNFEGDTGSVSPEMLNHLKGTRDVSNLILKFNLLDKEGSK